MATSTSDVVSKSAWDPFKTLDVSPNELKLMEMRKARRAHFKAEYQRLVTNPHGGGRGGYIFDSQIQRFMSGRATMEHFFRATPSTTASLVNLLIIPFGFMLYITHTSKKKEEARFRRGEVPVRERVWKFMT